MDLNEPLPGVSRGYVLCHCGKCNVECNLHGKLAKCFDCREEKYLGTIISRGILRHVCEDCIKVHQDKEEEESRRLQEKYSGVYSMDKDEFENDSFMKQLMLTDDKDMSIKDLLHKTEKHNEN